MGSLGHALKAKGVTADAVNAYEKAVDFARLWRCLLELGEYKRKFSDKMLKQMLSKSAMMQLDDKIHICFALGKGFEDNASRQGLRLPAG